MQSDFAETRVVSQYFPSDKAENPLFKARLATMDASRYSPAHALGRVVNMSGLALSKICSSLLVMFNEQRVNIGLNLKFEARGQKVLGYSRKGDGGWEYSQRAVDLIQEYRERFPEVAQALSTRRGGEFFFLALSFFRTRVWELILSFSLYRSHIR